MYRGPSRPQLSPGAPRPAGRFPSPGPCWGFPGAQTPYRGGSPRGGPAHSPGSPLYSPGSNRVYQDGSPSGFGGGFRGFGDSPGGFSSGSRGNRDSPGGFGGGVRGFDRQMRHRGGGFRRNQAFSPTAGSGQWESADSAVEKYFSPSMLQDPWEALQPVAQPQSS